MRKSLLTLLLSLCCAMTAMAQMPKLTAKEKDFYRRYDTDSYFGVTMQQIGTKRFMAYIDTLKHIAAAKDSTEIMAGAYGITLSHYRVLGRPDKMRSAVDSLQMYPFDGEWEEFIYSCWQNYPSYLSDKRHYIDALKALETMQDYTTLHRSDLGSIIFHYCSGYLFLSMFQSEQAEVHIRQAQELLTKQPVGDFRRSMGEGLRALLLRCYDASDNREMEHKLAMEMIDPATESSAYARMCAYVALFCSEEGEHAQQLRRQYADSVEALVRRQTLSAGVLRPYNKFRSVNAMYEGQIDSALYYANQAIDTLNCLVRSGIIYAHFGRYSEAYEMECAAYRELNERSRADLTASLSQQIDRMEKERLEHELQINEAKARQRLLIYSLAFAVIIIVSVGYEVVRTLRHSRDLEREKQATQEALREAEQASRMKTVFLQNISHEVRTPLNAISGFSDILMCGITLTPEQQSEYAGLVRHNVDLLTTLMGDTITLSDLDSQTVVPSMSDTDLNALCRTIMDETPVQKYVQPGVEFHYTPTDQPVVRNTDPQVLLSILTHLLSNAFKYTSEGSVTLSLQVTADGRAQIAVTDTGCGIASENAERVFDRFEKLGSFVQGNGLGLAIAREQARLIGATVNLDTTHKAPGARFVVEV